MKTLNDFLNKKDLNINEDLSSFQDALKEFNSCCAQCKSMNVGQFKDDLQKQSQSWKEKFKNKKKRQFKINPKLNIQGLKSRYFGGSIGSKLDLRLTVSPQFNSANINKSEKLNIDDLTISKFKSKDSTNEIKEENIIEEENEEKTKESQELINRIKIDDIKEVEEEKTENEEKIEKIIIKKLMKRKMKKRLKKIKKIKMRIRRKKMKKIKKKLKMKKKKKKKKWKRKRKKKKQRIKKKMKK